MSLFQKSIEEKCLYELDFESDFILATELKNITNSSVNPNNYNRALNKCPVAFIANGPDCSVRKTSNNFLSKTL